MNFRTPRKASLTVIFCALSVLLIRVTAANDLIVSDPGIGKIYRITPDRMRKTIASVTTGTGLAFDHSGKLYVTDFNESIVYKVGPHGTLRPIISGIEVSNPAAIIFDRVGNLFVYRNGFDDAIVKLATDGTLSVFASGVAGSGLAFDAAGNLFASDYFSNTVLKYAPDGTVTTFASGFSHPTGLAFDAEGNLFVADLVALIIYKITPDGIKTEFATNLSQPLGLAFDEEGNLFVADYPRILKIAPDGTRTVFASGLAPWGLVFRP